MPAVPVEIMWVSALCLVPPSGVFANGLQTYRLGLLICCDSLEMRSCHQIFLIMQHSDLDPSVFLALVALRPVGLASQGQLFS